MSRPPSASGTETLADMPQNRISLARKLILLFIFFFSNLMVTLDNAAFFPASPIIRKALHATQGQSTWLLSASGLTSASFLFISGRISDIYNTKIVFVASLFFLGIFALGTGFANNITGIIILRALTGIASAMLIPSSLALLVRIFPEPLEQARAIGAIVACDSVGDVLGSLVGAALVQHTSYRWIFWLFVIFCVPVSLVSVLMIPAEIATSRHRPVTRSTKWKDLDLVGVFILTAAFILFIYALTTGPVGGWSSAGVLTPLIISIFLMVGFARWETLIPVERAVIPPCMWSYSNFAVLVVSTLFPSFLLSSTNSTFTTLWQDVFHWTAIFATIHMLPSTISGLLMSLTGGLSRTVNPKWIMLTGLTMAAVGTVLYAVGGGRPDYYWPYMFPGLVLGGAGAMLTFTHTNIAMFRAAPESIAGLIAAITSGVARLCSAVGIPVVDAIESSVPSTENGAWSYKGRATAFWFLFGLAVVEFLIIAFFYDRSTNRWDDETLLVLVQTRQATDDSNEGGLVCQWTGGDSGTTSGSEKVENNKLEASA